MSDEIDRATELTMYSTEVALRNRLRELSIESQRIVDGVVMCDDCENEIPLDRLAAKPDCIRCIDCQMAYEKELKL